MIRNPLELIADQDIRNLVKEKVLEGKTRVVGAAMRSE
jgi:hypothetical protein